MIGRLPADALGAGADRPRLVSVEVMLLVADSAKTLLPAF